MTNALIESTDPTQLGQRPMIALLKARPGMENSFRALLIDLVRETKREPGCVAFLLYEVLDTPGSFYLYEIYRDNAAFLRHLTSATVTRFKAALPSLSDSDQANDLKQLIEIPL